MSVPYDVADVWTPSYDLACVRASIARALAPFGGMRAFVRAGDRVLLKPNLLRAAHPRSAATTHPAVVEAVALLVIEAGARPSVGDSPAGAVRGIERVHERTGVRAAADRVGAPLLHFEASGAVSRRANGRTYLLARAVEDADVVINLAKLKTHTLTAMTGPLKNCYGVMPGFAKGTYHTRYPRPRDFAEIILDVAELARPALTIVDAVTCMDGEGPSTGRPVFRGRILAGAHAADVEHAAAQVLGVVADDMPVLRAARARGLLDRAPRVWREPGPPHAALRPASYWAARHIPRSAAALLRRTLWVRAAVVDARCTRCGECLGVCPVHAIAPAERSGGPPRIDAAACVGCLVCVTRCADQAIAIAPSSLARMFV